MNEELGGMSLGEPWNPDVAGDGSPGAVDESSSILALRQLGVESPPQPLSRFRKRAAVMQGTRMLFESQVTGFWVVLDAFLRLALGRKPVAAEAASEGDVQ
jgi:hypothetical protein